MTPTVLEEIVAGYVHGDVPGVVVGVRRPDDLTVVARGEASPGTALESSTPFRTSSTTKTVTAVIALQLKAEGALDLDAPLGETLPADIEKLHVVDGTSRSHELTVRHLLTHTSGLADYAGDDAWLDAVAADPARVWTPQQLLDWAAHLGEALFLPGEGFAYCDTGYVLVGLLIEVLEGKPFHEVLRTRVLEPLDLRDTRMEWHEDGPPWATAYVGEMPMGEMGTADAFAAGGLISTAADLSRLFLALGRDELLADPAELLWTTPQSGHLYGPGIRRYELGDVDAWGHAGFAGCIGAVVPARQAAVGATLLQNAAVERGVHVDLLRDVVRVAT